MTKGELDERRRVARAARKAARQGRTLDGSLVSVVGCRELVDKTNPNKRPPRRKGIGKKGM